MHKVHTSIGSLREREEVGRLTGTDVVLLQLGKDVFPVGVLPQSANMRSDFVHENLPLCRLRHVYHLLYNIVGILIFHHCVQGTEGGRER